MMTIASIHERMRTAASLAYDSIEQAYNDVDSIDMGQWRSRAGKSANRELSQVRWAIYDMRDYAEDVRAAVERYIAAENGAVQQLEAQGD